jgi:putative hemolysin
VSSIGSAAVRPDSLRARLGPNFVTDFLATSIDRLLTRRTGIHRHSVRSPTRNPAQFAKQLLDRLDVLTIVRGAADAVPARGGLIVVANHPFGGLEDLILYTVLAGRRQDVRVLGNDLVKRMPEFTPAVFGVDVGGGRDAMPRNAVALRRAVRWVKKGGALIVFPAAEVADLDPVSRTTVDPPWHPSVARLIELTRAPVVLAYVDGSNSTLCQAAGWVHPTLRTALLARELLNKRKHPIELTFGRPVPAVQLAAAAGDHALTEQLRLQLYALACRDADGPSGARPAANGGNAPRSARAELADEVSAIPTKLRLRAVGDLELWRVNPRQVPLVVRAMGQYGPGMREGIGPAAVSPDAPDSEQLFVWNTKAREVVAGIRVGVARNIVARLGVTGLPTSARFDVRTASRSALDAALELDGAFASLESDYSVAGARLLWGGIGVCLAEHPECRILFGVFSVGHEYTPASRALVAAYLRTLPTEQAPFGRLRALRTLPAPPAARRLQRELRHIGSMGPVESALLALEPMRRRLPVLLRQCLQLGARPAGIGLDSPQASSLDVLMAVDLAGADPEVTSRYFGRENAERLASLGSPQRPARRALPASSLPRRRPNRASAAPLPKRQEWMRALQ